VSLHADARPALTQLLLIVTMLGMQGVVLIGIIVAIFFIVRRAWLNLLIWVVALAGGEVLNLLLKAIFARPRPVFDVPLVVEKQFSFPSGHAMMSIICYGLLAYFIFGALHSRRWRVIIGAGIVLLVLFIGFTRLYLGAHYLTDVVGGFAAGWVWLSTCIYALGFARSRLGERLDRSPPNAL
jgi:undecaprenyl-diphosphatase